jgi:hypothetical protein
VTAGVVAVGGVIPLPFTDAGQQQLGDGSLIGLEQFIRPLQTLKLFAQRLNLLIMGLDFLLDRGDLLAQSPLERIYRIHPHNGS